VELVLVALRQYMVLGRRWMDVTFVVNEDGAGERAWGSLVWVGRHGGGG